jgi:hypothetical protein
MSYKHCEKHDLDATNGCKQCEYEVAHFHPCSDGRFCGGLGYRYCNDPSCRQSYGDGWSRKIPNLSGRPCRLCQLGRWLLEREKIEDPDPPIPFG